MRVNDVRDWFALRRLCENPGPTLRFREQQRAGDEFEVRMRSSGPIYLRGAYADFHMLHRIWLRDEYRLRRLGGAPLDCVVDLGGNVGIFARRAAAIARRVITCEPAEENYRYLTRNCAECPNIEPRRVAISSSDGELRLYRPHITTMSGVHSVHRELAGGGFLSPEYEQVPAVSLDSLFRQCAIQRCDLLKIDIEGHEYEVLGAASEETLAKIGAIAGEYHALGATDAMRALAERLRGSGFHVEIIPHRRKAGHGMFFARSAGLQARA